MATQIRFGAVFTMSVVLSVLAGCDDPEKAESKCESMVTTYCDRVVSCAQDADILNASFGANDLRSECEGFLRDDAHCSEAVRPGKHFDQCVDEASQLSCSDIVDTLLNADSQNERYISSLPDSCQGAIVYVED